MGFSEKGIPFSLSKPHLSTYQSICLGIWSRFGCEFFKHYFVKILANAQSISCVFASHCFKNSTPKIGTTKTKAKLLLFRGGRVQQYEVLQDRQQRKSLILLVFGDLRCHGKCFTFGYPLTLFGFGLNILHLFFLPLRQDAKNADLCPLVILSGAEGEVEESPSEKTLSIIQKHRICHSERYKCVQNGISV